MKRKIINFLILVFLGVCVYFGYNKFFGDCDKSCESKDSCIVAKVEIVDSVSAKKDTVSVCDTTSKK